VTPRPSRQVIVYDDAAVDRVAQILHMRDTLGRPGRSVGDDSWQSYTWDELPQCREPWQDRYRAQARQLLDAAAN
jgi:hypothetical protein